MASQPIKVLPEEIELLDTVPYSTQTRYRQEPALGIPRACHRLSTSDWSSTLTCLSCFMLGFITVFNPAVSFKLGQVNQLIALGVLLQIMAICTQRQVQHFLLVSECLWNKSSLQNFESILHANIFAPNTTWFLKIAILSYLALPVGLGASYKRFTGGWMTSQNTTGTGVYGMTGPPGTMMIGTGGIPLFLNATLAWWSNPVSFGSSGFNLNVEAANRTALLDGPTPEYVSYLQSMLQPDDIMELKASTNATVAELVFDLADPSSTKNLAYWYNNKTVASMSPRQATDDFWHNYYTNVNGGHDSLVCMDNHCSRTFAMLIPAPNTWIWNNSFIMTSRYNGGINETFGSAAQGFKLYRQKYEAVWTITSSSVLLNSANMIPGKVLKDTENRNMIEKNWLKLELFYPQIFREYDWKYMGDLDGVLADASRFPTITSVQHEHVKTDTTLVAAMLWSRLATFAGLGNPYFNDSQTNVFNSYRYQSQSVYEVRTKTLKQSYLLVIVLATNPIILILALATRLIMLNDAPISNNFGLTSLLASIETDSLSLLKGASYSGRLQEDVRLKFSVIDWKSPYNDKSTGRATPGRGEITARLQRTQYEDEGRTNVWNDRIGKGVVYE